MQRPPDPCKHRLNRCVPSLSKNGTIFNLWPYGCRCAAMAYRKCDAPNKTILSAGLSMVGRIYFVHHHLGTFGTDEVLLPVSKSKKNLFVVFLILFVVGVLISFHGIGNIIAGISLICISLWLMRNDLIGITIRKNDLPKFVAISLLAGYTALLLAGILFVTFSNEWLAYDAIVHTFFIGFVFSMIFAHGPIILPGVLGSSIKPFHKILYLWLFLLHSSWLLRIFGDAFVNLPLRRMSGALSAVAILAYLITLFLTLRMQFKNADKSHIRA